MKTCAGCGVEKSRAEFYVRRASKDGLNRLCKPCDKKQVRQWCIDHPQKRKKISDKYRLANPEKLAASVLRWQRANPDKVAVKWKRWAKAHPEVLRAWVINNPEKIKEKSRRYHKAHPDVALAWARANREKVNAKSAQWRKGNPEKSAASCARWSREHPEITAAQCGKRRAARISACPPWADLEVIKEKYKEARRLTVETGVKYHVDHEYPLRGVGFRGLHVDWNLQVIPAFMNLKKGNRLIPDVGVRASSMVI